MYLKRITILNLLFIFGLIIHIRAEPIKTVNYTAYREKTIKIDENEAAIKTMTESAPSPGISHIHLSNSSTQLNLLIKSPEVKKGVKLAESIDKAISYSKFDQNVWRHQFLGSWGITETKSANSEFGQSNFNPYPNGNEDFEKGRTLAVFKLLNPKRAEALTEIFLLFRLRFNPKDKHMFLEMNSTPFSEKGKGLSIPY